MPRRNVVISIALLLTIGAIVATLFRAPLYPTYSAAQCLEAYAGARNRTDSAQVDLHPYAPATETRAKHRCGEVRAVAANAVDLLPR